MTTPTIDEQIECLDIIHALIGYVPDSTILLKLDAAIASLKRLKEIEVDAERARRASAEER